MDEREFTRRKREGWEQLAALVEKANSKSGVKALSREELLALGPLYRRACSDLAYARVHAVSADLVAQLNGLVGQTHALLYEAEHTGRALRSVVDFYLYDFPALLQKHIRYFLAAFGLTVIGAFYAYWFVQTHPAQEEVFIPPQFKKSFDIWKKGGGASASSTEFSGALFANNQRVGLIAYATGVVAGVPTCYMLFENGATSGRVIRCGHAVASTREFMARYSAARHCRTDGNFHLWRGGYVAWRFAAVARSLSPFRVVP